MRDGSRPICPTRLAITIASTAIFFTVSGIHGNYTVVKEYLMPASNDKNDPDNNLKVPSQEERNTKEVKKAEHELSQAIRGSHEILHSATTAFPFTLFPDTVTIDRAKITITKRAFISVAEIMSIRIEDILNVTANIGPFFGSLHIVSRVLSPDKPYEVKFLWRDDALKIKRILQGYIIAMQKNIDVTPLKTDELATLLDELGLGDPEKNN